MDQLKPEAPREPQPAPAQPERPARKPYARPAIVSEMRLEARAGTPLFLPDPPNEYGL